MNATITKFGYPATLVREYTHWVVLVRAKHITLGALTVCCKEEATRFSDISTAAFTELKQVTTDVEAMLAKAVEYEKINYLMLMMVDPHVHFHVIPRYAGTRSLGALEFPDQAWPTPPALDKFVQLDESGIAAVKKLLGAT